jgi:acetyltransferase
MALKRFDPARFFHPASIAISGAATPLGQTLLANLRAASFTGTITETDPDLALVADDAPDVPAALKAHAANGARAAIVLSDAPGLASSPDIRVLGPYSYGLVLPALGLNASIFTTIPPRGRIALVGQSASLARCVIDWAIPNHAGFSHIAGIGGNTDIGFGMVLDTLSRDPNTAAILLEIDHLRDPRLFLTAARAAARLRPVIAIAPGLRLREAQGRSRIAFEAAFARAGVLLTGSISEFLAAAETLTRVKPARGESLAIISNSSATGRLAADAALESGLRLAELTPSTAQILGLMLGTIPGPGPIDAGPMPARLAEVAALLSPVPEVGGILVVHAPSGGDDEAAIEALVACAKTVKIPLLIAALGETQGAAHRHRLAQAGLACFDSPEAAIAGFRHLLRNRRNRAAARELPASEVLDDNPAAGSLLGTSPLLREAALAAVAEYQIPVVASRHAATPEEAAEAAEALGYPVVVKLTHAEMPANRPPGSIAFDLADRQAVLAAATAMQIPDAGFLVQTQVLRGTQLRIRVSDDALLGPVIGFGAGGGDPEDVSGLAADLPPLNLALAHALIQRAGVAPALAAHRGLPAADEGAVAAMLVRVSRLVEQRPEILRLDLDPIFAHAQGAVAASGRILPRPPGTARPALVFSPYPAELTRRVVCKGQGFTLRPIRPEDADGYAAMFERFSQEDMRYRFFSAQKHLPAEQITRMTDVDYEREMAMIAVNEATGEPAGGARLVRGEMDGAVAEFAVGVEPAAKGLGLASILMRAVIDWGRDHGVTEITGQILADNAPMLAFIRRLGFTIERIPGEHEIVEATLTL